MNSTLKILLIEDDLGDQTLFSEFMEGSSEKKYLVKVANSLKEAFCFLEDLQFDVIFSDLSLPDSSGKETFLKISEKSPNTPIILLTGLNDENFAIQMLNSGVQDYLVKGDFDAKLLSRVIHYAIARKSIENQLKQTQEKLESSNLALQNFTGVVSHDLKAPLGVILLRNSILRDQFQDQLGEEGLKHVQKIESNCRRMNQLIDALLSLTKVENQSLNLIEVNLNSVLKEVSESLESRLLESHGKIEITSELPTLLADKTQMSQLFQNLISNSLKFHRENVEPIITISATRANNFHVIALKDNGIGFDQKDADRIFNICERLNGREKFEGSGIGLSICKKIIERHHGKIHVTSVVNQGTEFSIEIPV